MSFLDARHDVQDVSDPNEPSSAFGHAASPILKLMAVVAMVGASWDLLILLLRAVRAGVGLMAELL